MAPDYAKAARRLRNQDPPINIAKLDATAHTETATKYNVRGYPTIKFFRNGEVLDFNGDRTEQGITNWVLKKMGSAVVYKDSHAALEKVKAGENVIIVFFGDKGHENFAPFEAACYSLDDINCLHVDDSESLTAESAEAGQVILFKNFDEGKNVYAGKQDKDAILKWVGIKSVPAYSEFDQKMAGLIFSEGNPGLFLFREDSDTANDKVMKSVAAELSDSIFITYSQITEGLGKRLSDFVGITSTDLPSVWVIHPQAGQRDMKKYQMESEITAENIKSFVSDFKDGKLKGKLKSEDIPKEPLDNHVRVLVGKNFEEVAYDESKDVLVEFYAPWCGHCKKLAPEYESAAETLSHVESLVVAKMDATANDVEGVPISGFPTLKFFPANSGRKIEDYNGPREAAGIVNWLKSHANVKFDLKEEL